MNITMKLVCAFFFSYVITINASSRLDEDGSSIHAISHHRELEVIYCNGDGGANNVPNCYCDDPFPFFDDMMMSMFSCHSAERYDHMACGGCHGSCSGTNECLNLDFHCAEGMACELSCTGENSCEGVTMYCPDNQVCAIPFCGDGTERCIGATVICGSGTVAVGDFACEPFLYEYEIMSVLRNVGTSTLGGTGTNNYGAIFELNFEHSNELCLNDCDPNELTVSVYNSFNGENQCEGDAFDSTTQTVTVIDGSFLQDGDMPQYSNGKISKIEVTFDDVFEANIISSSTANGSSSGSSGISLCIRVETTDGTHMFDKLDTAITQSIELNGEITTSKLGVANFDTESKNLVLDDGTLTVEGTPVPYMCSEDGANDSSTAVIGSTMNICVPDDEQFQVDYIKNVICSNGSEDFNPFDTADGTTGSSYTIGDGASGQMIGIEIKAEYLPANSRLSLFECSGVIVFSYNNGERRLGPHQFQESTVEEPEAKFSLTIMITNKDPTIDSAGNKMAATPVSTIIITPLILQTVAIFMNKF